MSFKFCEPLFTHLSISVLSQPHGCVCVCVCFLEDRASADIMLIKTPKQLLL